MTMGRSKTEEDLFRSVHEVCDAKVGARSVFRLLAEQGHLLLPDEMFADLYSSRGRRSISPRVMATVMVLQRFEAGGAGGLGGLEDGAGFVEGVEGVGELEEIIGEDVGAEVVEDLRNGFAELEEFFCEGELGGVF